MEDDFLTITGAREHNLKNVNLSIPKGKFVVFTGVSGSGKSSLAFDTIFAEGQRRYVESLSAYARQFLGQMEKPKYDSIRGLAPTISIEQKSVSNNPRSTVGTVTEIYDYLRVLFARIGEQRCFKCGRSVTRQDSAQIVKEIARYPEGTRAVIMSPIVSERKGEFRELLQQIRKDGFLRARVDGIVVDLSEEISLDKNKKHSIYIVVDRLAISGDSIPRLNDSVETALKFGKGRIAVHFPDGREERIP
ncbi:MAG: excinuclease ABC subunit UvrA, partial [Deltaproteobacteria bacterium]|nr:excinuclease ABC subunit UvrA [Deltaproteobacteria bacterium]